MKGGDGFERVVDARVSPDMSVAELIELYRKIHGFMAGHLAEAVEVLREGMGAELRFLSFTGNLISTGLRGVLAQAIREKLFNVVITTCGAVDHDIARSFGGEYYKGFFEADDSQLHERGVHRLGNVFIPVESYGPLIERVVFKVMDELAAEKKSWSVRELLWEFGKRIDDENSILRAAYETRTPIYVPGIVDGSFGTALFMHSQSSGVKLDLLADMKELADLVFTAKTSAALIIGGGISKHHTIWWNQFKDGLDYVVYVTTAVEYDGSLSGAHPREAISWGKVKPRSRRVVVYADATLVVPIIIAGLLS